MLQLTREDIFHRIDQAFQNAVVPQTWQELAEPGIEAEHVIKHFLGKSRQDIQAATFFPSLEMEDFTYMTENAVAYYLPPVLKILLTEPDDEELWIFLSGFLNSISDSYGRNLRALSALQREAIADWADFLRHEWEKTWSIDPSEAAKVSIRYRGLAHSGG